MKFGTWVSSVRLVVTMHTSESLLIVQLAVRQVNASPLFPWDGKAAVAVFQILLPQPLLS